MTNNNQTAPVTDEELDQMIWKLERDGMTPKQLSLMRELREVRRAKAIYQVLYGECWRDVTEEQYHDHAVHESPIRILYTAPPAPAVPDTFMPKNLDRALGVVGVALPESKEEFNFQIERWTQRLIDRVIRYADEFQTPPAPVVPDVIATDDIPYSVGRFRTHRDCYRDGWNACRAAMLQPDGTLTNEGTMQLSGNSEQLEPVSNRDELKKGLAAIRNSGIAIDGEKILAERDVLNSPVTPDGWIPVSERMPDEDGNYWGWWSESKRQGPVWFIKSELQAQFQSSEITHWMPLSAAPKEEG